MKDALTVKQLKEKLEPWPDDMPIVASVGNQFFGGEATWFNLVDVDEPDNGPVLLHLDDEPSMC